LGPALASSNLDAFINHSYWTQDYVGLGPYRLDRWEPGAFIEASAFDRHALGAPKIQRIKILFFNDSGSALAAMLAGDAQVATDSALTVSRGVTLLREWPAGTGYAVQYYGTWVAAHFQGRPELLSPPALQDRRVRQALAYAVDRPSLNDAIYEGQYLLAASSFAPTSEIGKAADAAAVKYPFDLARSAQLMAEAGFTRPPGAEFYVGPTGQRFSPELKGSDGQDEPLSTAMVSHWRQAGIDAHEAQISARLATSLEVKSQFSGLYIGATSEGERGVGAMHSDNIPTAQNGWRGSGVAFNGYSNPELDRLVVAFGGALNVADRSGLAADIAKLWSTDLPAIHMFFTVSSQIFSSDVKGPRQRPASSSVHWNVHEWELN
ncbi:MAG TPA: ABC transporter substrate-binding protein, partial [Chloroflexota bacterium]